MPQTAYHTCKSVETWNWCELSRGEMLTIHIFQHTLFYSPSLMNYPEERCWYQTFFNILPVWWDLVLNWQDAHEFKLIVKNMLREYMLLSEMIYVWMHMFGFFCMLREYSVKIEIKVKWFMFWIFYIENKFNVKFSVNFWT